MNTAQEPAHESPLWMVSQAPALNALVVQLQHARTAHDQGTSGGKLELSKRQLVQARSEFSEMIRRGERELHQLAGLLADAFLGPHQLRSVVIGEVEKTRERFTLIGDVSREELERSTDLDLGTRLLARLAVADERGWRRIGLVSNVVEYEPAAPNPCSVYRILTRIKAEQEIWNKVTDEIFDLDAIVLRDKHLRHLGRYVKDVFGIKMVVGTLEDAYRLQNELVAHDFGEGAPSRRLEVIEVKDYLERPSRKQSGWSALKSVVSWGGRTFEIQVQPLSNFLHERERLTRESHQGFKSTRERVRDEVAAKVPLFGFYRSLLRWLLLDPSADPPVHEGIELSLVD
ncbi:MAG: hypothetical protein JNK82_41545 [Myxococcaceae bacterium]|nr:hypothetical protein [Myxococcaceae bacterium]